MIQPPGSDRCDVAFGDEVVEAVLAVVALGKPAAKIYSAMKSFASEHDDIHLSVYVQ